MYATNKLIYGVLQSDRNYIKDSGHVYVLLNFKNKCSYEQLNEVIEPFL